METEEVINEAGTQPEIVDLPVEPAPGAEETKPTEPAADADEQKSDTPEQIEQKRESRRARANARKAAELAEAKTEARMLREQLEAERAKSRPAVQEPKREEFETLEDYHRALAKHEAKAEAERIIKAEREVRQAQEGKSRQVQTEERIAKEWKAREEAFKSQAKDYEESVSAFIDDEEFKDLDSSARRSILKSDAGPSVLYYLSKNPDEAARIAELSPERQIAELGKLELKATPAKKTSNAPPVVSGVRGQSTSPSYRDGMSDSEFREWSKKQGARWAQ